MFGFYIKKDNFYKHFFKYTMLRNFPKFTIYIKKKTFLKILICRILLWGNSMGYRLTLDFDAF